MRIFQPENALTFELFKFSRAGCRHPSQMSIGHRTGQACAIVQELEILRQTARLLPAAPRSSRAVQPALAPCRGVVNAENAARWTPDEQRITSRPAQRPGNESALELFQKFNSCIYSSPRVSRTRCSVLYDAPQSRDPPRQTIAVAGVRREWNVPRRPLRHRTLQKCRGC